MSLTPSTNQHQTLQTAAGKTTGIKTGDWSKEVAVGGHSQISTEAQVAGDMVMLVKSASQKRCKSLQSLCLVNSSSATNSTLRTDEMTSTYACVRPRLTPERKVTPYTSQNQSVVISMAFMVQVTEWATLARNKVVYTESRTQQLRDQSYQAADQHSYRSTLTCSCSQVKITD